jgi:beta-N-acetylhexosaminidase
MKRQESNRIAQYFLILNLLLHICFSFSLFGLSLSDLSLEEKVGQLLMVHFHGQEANEEAKRLIQEVHVGGIIYYNWANELSHPQQVQTLSRGLQQLAQKTPHAIPLLIAIDQEGGCISRLKQGFTVFPGNYALGQTREWQWGEESCWMMGRELKAVGISLNLAPVVDVYTQPANPVIGIRAFSSDPTRVARWGSYAIQGYKKAGVIAALKHFPGHGDVQVDSHEALPVVDKKREVLEQVELYPFRLLASQADVILTAHLLIPALDAQYCTTFSKKIISDILRKELNFHGVIMTDSLAMRGVLSQCSSLEEAVLKSLEAGHDMILLGGKQLLYTPRSRRGIAAQNGSEFTVADIQRIHRFLIDAIRQGQLSEQRINESVARILALKQKFGLFDFAPLTPALLKSHVHTEAHCALAQRIARQALRLVQGKNLSSISFDASSLLVVAPDCLRDEMTQTAWHLPESQVQIFYFRDLNPNQATIQAITSAAEKAKKCFYLSYNAWQYSGQRELFQQLQKTSPSVMAIVVGNPLDVDYLNSINGLLCTFSPVACSLQAAFDYLTHLTHQESHLIGKGLDKISKPNAEREGFEPSIPFGGMRP